MYVRCRNLTVWRVLGNRFLGIFFISIAPFFRPVFCGRKGLLHLLVRTWGKKTTDSIQPLQDHDIVGDIVETTSVDQLLL